MKTVVTVLLGVLCYAVVVLPFVFPHPLFSGSTTLHYLSVQTSEQIQYAIQRFKLLSYLDTGVPWAIGGLFFSFLYVCVYVLVRGVPGSSGSSADPSSGKHSNEHGSWVTLLGALVGGYVAGCLFVVVQPRTGNQVFSFYPVIHVVTGLLIWGTVGVCYWMNDGDRVGRLEGVEEQGGWSQQLNVLVWMVPGLLLLFILSPLDSGIQYLSRGDLFPAFWFTLLYRFRTSIITFIMEAAALCFAVSGVERARSSRAPLWLDSLLTAPVYILMLGPSAPVKGAVVALMTAYLARKQAGRSVRILFVLLTQLSIVCTGLLLEGAL